MTTPLTQPSVSRHSSQAIKQTRILSCMRCQQRKLKCERKFPCANCVTSSAKCVPTPLIPRQRRRRFTERELLDRIRSYEGLLRENNIAFEPLHPGSTSFTKNGQRDNSLLLPQDGLSEERNVDITPPITPCISSPAETPSSLKSMNQQSDRHLEGTAYAGDAVDNDAGYLTLTDEATIQEAMDQLGQDDNFLLFLAPSMELDLSHLRPSPAHVFSLWQVYLDNVNPVLKVTHTPTLQSDVVNAVNNPSAIEPTLEALLFGVYCVAILSLTEAECLSRFNSTRSELLARYQIACRESLLRCKFLRSRSRNCLTALYLYLISIKPHVDRRSLCMMLGTAIRIAQQIGIDNESTNMRCSPFEAEMRRRLWWSLVLFDARVCESSHNLGSSTLVPSWDCKMPGNFNDFEIGPDTKSLPMTHDYPTEALYIVVCNTIAQHIRYSDSNLDFVRPAYTNTERRTSNGTGIENVDDLTALEETLQRKCFSGCHPENPLHFLAQWAARSQLAKARLMKHYWTSLRRPLEVTDSQRDAAMNYALDLIECEAQLSNSPKTSGFRWHFTHFPFLPYAHIIQDLKKRPSQQSARKAWATLGNDFHARFAEQPVEGHPIFLLLANGVIQAWKDQEASLMEKFEEEPWIVQEMKRISPSTLLEPSLDSMMNIDLDEFLPLPSGFAGEYLQHNALAR